MKKKDLLLVVMVQFKQLHKTDQLLGLNCSWISSFLLRTYTCMYLVSPDLVTDLEVGPKITLIMVLLWLLTGAKIHSSNQLLVTSSGAKNNVHTW